MTDPDALPIQDDIQLRTSSPPEPAPPPRPRVVTMDDTPTPEVREHERQRNEAFDVVHEWNGIALHPFSEARERLFQRLCAADVPLPRAVDSDQLDAFTSHAVKLLYLCSHEPREFRHLRPDTGRFLEAIDTWGEKHVPRADTGAAVLLALKINNEYHRSIAIVRPTDKGAAQAGNAPCP